MERPFGPFVLANLNSYTCEDCWSMSWRAFHFLPHHTNNQTSLWKLTIFTNNQTRLDGICRRRVLVATSVRYWRDPRRLSYWSASCCCLTCCRRRWITFEFRNYISRQTLRSRGLAVDHEKMALHRCDGFILNYKNSGGVDCRIFAGISPLAASMRACEVCWTRQRSSVSRQGAEG